VKPVAVAQPLQQQQPELNRTLPLQQQQQSRPLNLPTAVAGPRPQPQKSSSIDILAALIRAKTKDAKDDDKHLLNHIESCTLPICSNSLCAEGKEKLRHFNQCAEPKCFHCVKARFFEAVEMGASKVLGEKLTQGRTELQEHVSKVKCLNS
jgi:hypothetical protein